MHNYTKVFFSSIDALFVGRRKLATRQGCYGWWFYHRNEFRVGLGLTRSSGC